MKRIGEPPPDLGKRAAWISLLLAETAFARMTGRIGSELAADLRAIAAAMDRAIAPQLQAQLDRPRSRR